MVSLHRNTNIHIVVPANIEDALHLIFQQHYQTLFQ